MHTFYKYGSHVPVLMHVGANFPVKTVVEFGLGIHSTFIFLMKNVFPDLQKVYSYECSQMWIDKIKTVINDFFNKLTHREIEAILPIVLFTILRSIQLYSF